MQHLFQSSLRLFGLHPALIDWVMYFWCGRDQQKGEALGHLFKKINESLGSTGSFPPLGKEEQGSPAQPQAHVWTQFQLAQHYDMQGRTGGRSAHTHPYQQALLCEQFVAEQPLYATSCANAQHLVCSSASRVQAFSSCSKLASVATGIFLMFHVENCKVIIWVIAK